MWYDIGQFILAVVLIFLFVYVFGVKVGKTQSVINFFIKWFPFLMKKEIAALAAAAEEAATTEESSTDGTAG